MSQPKPIYYQIHFVSALLAGFFMAALAFWAIESGFRLAAVSAAVTFAIIWLYAVIAWVLWAQARFKSKRSDRNGNA